MHVIVGGKLCKINQCIYFVFNLTDFYIFKIEQFYPVYSFENNHAALDTFKLLETFIT